MSGAIMSNTVKLEFPVGSPQPAWAEIAGFIKNLHTDLTTMDTVYKMGIQRSVYIKYKTEAAMLEALRKHPDVIKFHYSSGKFAELRMWPAGIELQYVRVFDLPPEVADNDLCSILGKYGRIQRTIREKFAMDLGIGQLFNGVRGLFMQIDGAIPPTLEVGKWKVKVYYDGLKEKCFLCQAEGHKRNTCPTAKEKRHQGTTYAGVVEVGAAALPDEIIEEIIDVSEEENTEKVQSEAPEVMGSAPKEFVAATEIEVDEERLKEIDEAAEKLGLDNFRENIAKLSELIDQYPSDPSTSKDQASFDAFGRAQFAASGSKDSTGLRPKKAARKSNK